MNYHIAIITATNNHKNLKRFLYNIGNQSFNGLNAEIIVIQEHDEASQQSFDIGNLTFPIKNLKIANQPIHNDYGATAKDRGIALASAQYLVFWDDDNIYYPHALVSQYLNATGFDIGISKVVHQNLTIPINRSIDAGYIDTMCLCVKRTLAQKERWSSVDGRYTDFRWVDKLSKHHPMINYSEVIIGQHL